MLNCGNGSLGVLPQRNSPRTSPEPPVVAAEGYRARGPTRELSRTRQGHVNPPRRQGAVRVPAEYSTRCDVTYWRTNTTPNGRNFLRRTLYGISYRLRRRPCATNEITLMAGTC